MGLAPLNTPLHANPRSRRPANAGINNTSIPMPGPSQQPRRLMSPTSDEATSPRATENMSSYSPTHRTLSTPTDFADKVVEDVLDDASEEEVDESILLGHELWAALASRPFEERSGLGWKGWLGVAAVSVVCGSVLMIAGNARKVPCDEKEGPSYCLQDRPYH